MRLEDGADEDGANLLTAHVVHVKRKPVACRCLPWNAAQCTCRLLKQLKKQLAKAGDPHASFTFPL